MAQWQIFKGKNAGGAPLQVGELFDDGELSSPEDQGFDTKARDAEVKNRGGDGWSYVGRSTQVSAKMANQITAEVDAIVGDEGNDISNEAVARRMVLAARGLNDKQ
jgi:hypothetical protein